MEPIRSVIGVVSPENDHAYPPAVGRSGGGGAGPMPETNPMLTLVPETEPNRSLVCSPMTEPEVPDVPAARPERFGDPPTLPPLILLPAVSPDSAGDPSAEPEVAEVPAITPVFPSPPIT